MTGLLADQSLSVRAAAAVALSLAGNAVVLALARFAAVAPGFRALTWPPVLLLTTLGAVGAVAVYWLLARRTADPDRSFRRVALAVLLVSFLPDLGLLVGDPDATVPAVLVLMGMHVVVAAACLATLSGR